MERKQYFVCEKCKDIQDTPLVLHIFGDGQCSVLLAVCKKCHKQNMDDLVSHT